MKKIEDYNYLNVTTDQMNIGDMFFVEVRNIFGLSLTQDYSFINECEEGYFDLPIVYDKNTFQHTFFKEKDFFVPLHNLYMDIRYPSKQVAIDIRNKSITLLRYLGNGEFLEYYTDCIIRYENIPVYVNLDDVLQKRVDVTAIKFMDSYVTFMRKYNGYLKKPLYIERGTLLPFNNSELKTKFDCQEKNKRNSIKDA